MRLLLSQECHLCQKHSFFSFLRCQKTPQGALSSPLSAIWEDKCLAHMAVNFSTFSAICPYFSAPIDIFLPKRAAFFPSDHQSIPQSIFASCLLHTIESFEFDVSIVHSLTSLSLFPVFPRSAGHYYFVSSEMDDRRPIEADNPFFVASDTLSVSSRPTLPCSAESTTTTMPAMNGHHPQHHAENGFPAEVSPSSASVGSSSGGSKSSVSTNPARRPPDMMMGRCPWVRVYDNVTYIVAAIALRDTPRGREVLLMQEAKEKCRGKWYMPAGHVEPGETLEEACKRELREETGMECAVETLISMEVRGSGWYRMAFNVEVTGGQLKSEPDQESLGAGWHLLETVRRRKAGSNAGPPLALRCRDFLDILAEAERFANWKTAIGDVPKARPPHRWAPVLNRDEAQPGLFAEFVIVKQSSISQRVECLVHRCIKDQLQLLDELTVPDAFPSVEFGFEFFLPSVVSRVYRHILQDGPSVLELPEAIIAVWCLPAPVSSVRHGIRIRMLCRHKRSAQRGQILAPQRYHWIELNHPEVLCSLYLLDPQFRPKLSLL